MKFIASLVIALLLFIASPTACAQESGREWKIAGQDGTYQTQRDAEMAIRLLEPQPEYGYVRHIQSQTISEDEIRITYWMGREPSEFSPWSYYRYPGSIRYSSEQDVIDETKALIDQKSRDEGCPVGATLIGRTDSLLLLAG